MNTVIWCKICSLPCKVRIKLIKKTMVAHISKRTRSLKIIYPSSRRPTKNIAKIPKSRPKFDSSASISCKIKLAFWNLQLTQIFPASKIINCKCNTVLRQVSISNCKKSHSYFELSWNLSVVVNLSVFLNLSAVLSLCVVLSLSAAASQL